MMRFVRCNLRLAVVVALLLSASGPLAARAIEAAGGQEGLRLNARARKLVPSGGHFAVVEQRVEWSDTATAVIVCDMWDRHWCAGASERVGEMSLRMNEVLKQLRLRGALIVHAPSDTMSFYDKTPQRLLARSAAHADPPSPIKRWCYLDPALEARLPIDDSDGGCDCSPHCAVPKGGPYPWTRQHPAIEIAEGDAISDNGQEIFNLFRQRGIRHVIVMGVHTNMCVLGRSFGIRQMTRLGFDVVLMRDMTDTMYNSRQPPHVPHDKGTDLVVEHVEKYWCPTVTSHDVLGDGRRPNVVFVIAEDEYKARQTLPEFAREELTALGFEYTILRGEDKSSVPGLEALEDADLLVVYMRRTSLPDEQIERFKSYFAAGRPLVALRTSSHAFQNWLEFDRIVLGCHYTGHYGKDGTPVHADAKAAGHPILRGVDPDPFVSPSWLYKVGSLSDSATILLRGSHLEQAEEAVAWTSSYNGGRIFYTSLGHPDDFQLPQFRYLLRNAILWGLDREIPEAK